mmetsp:Transcript_12507/g.14059  ORF Transcript_12507/g.14059 Transcript_12507/m.14059 type:complete len:243 (+) Transcript_12507:2076-2804(+)
MIQEDTVHGLSDGAEASEAERQVRQPAADLGTGQRVLNLFGGLNEVNGVVVVLLNASADREHVGVEDDVPGREAHLVNQDVVSPGADANLVGLVSSLSIFVEGHDHHSGAVPLNDLGLPNELFLAALQTDAVHSALALHLLQTRLDDVKLRRVDHDGHFANPWLGHDEPKELDHRRLAVEEAVVHVDIDNLGAVINLLQCDGQGLLVVASKNQPFELARARDVTPLPNVDEVEVAPRQLLQA